MSDNDNKRYKLPFLGCGNLSQEEVFRPMLQMIMKEVSPYRWRGLSKEEVKTELSSLVDEYWSGQEYAESHWNAKKETSWYK